MKKPKLEVYMLPETNTVLGFSVQLDMDYESALESVTAALKTEGFGVLTEIDVKATLKTKLDVDFRPYKILGACNPPLAYRALQAAPQIGLLLPCNVTVSQEEDHCLVSLIDPIAMMDVIQHPDLVPIAEEARAKLERVAAALQEK
jgi:uncharacterized protein (DUF302 family)